MDANIRIAASDVADLFQFALGLAKKLLGERGSFYPFGCVMGPDGKIELLGGFTGDEHPEAKEIRDLIEGAIRSAALEGAKAALVGVDAREVFGNGDRRDVVLLTAEHVDGEPLQMIVPYTRRWKQVKFEEPRTRPIDGRRLLG